MDNSHQAHQAVRGTTRPETFFGKVISYGKSPEGADGVLVDVLDKNGIVSGQNRLVVLDPGANIELAEGKERPGIAVFAKTGKSHTPPGGTLRIESAKESGQVWKARWVAGAVHNADKGSVFTAEARVTQLQVSPQSGNPYRILQVLRLDAAQRVTTVAELKDAVRAAIMDVGAGNAMLRLTNGAMVSANVVGAAGPTAEARAETVLTGNKMDVWVAMLEKGTHGNGLVEVIPVKGLFFGADSAKSPKLDQVFITPSPDGSEQYMKGFRSLLVSLEHRVDGSGFVTGVAFADGKGFARYGHASSASAAVPSAAQAQTPAPDERFEDDELPDIDLASIVDTAQASRSSGPGMG